MKNPTFIIGVVLMLLGVAIRSYTGEPNADLISSAVRQYHYADMIVCTGFGLFIGAIIGYASGHSAGHAESSAANVKKIHWLGKHSKPYTEV